MNHAEEIKELSDSNRKYQAEIKKLNEKLTGNISQNQIGNYQNKLEKSESVGIMMYLEEEGFLDEFEHVKEKPIKVHIQKIKF